MATIIRDKTGKVIGASRDSGVKVGSTISDKEAKEASKKKSSGKRKITYTTDKGGSYATRAEAEAALKAPQVERAQVVKQELAAAPKPNLVTKAQPSTSNIFSQNPDVVAQEQEKARLAKEYKEIREKRVEATSQEPQNVTIRKKTAFEKVQDFNKAGNQRLADTAKVIGYKTADIFAKKDERGRVITKSGTRTTVATERERAIANAKTSGQVYKTVATDILVDPLTLITAPALFVGGGAAAATKGAQAVSGASKVTKAVGVAKSIGISGAKATRDVVIASQVTKAAYPIVDEKILQAEAKKRDLDVNKLRKATAQVRQAGFRASEQYGANEKWYKQIAGEINVGFQNKGAFVKGAEMQLAETQNLSLKEREAVFNAAVRQRGGRAVTQLAGDLAISTRSELLGRETTANVFQAIGKTQVKGAGKTAFKVAGISAIGTATAGAFEGAAQEINQQAAKGVEQDLKRVAVMGGLGVASTVAISGSIAGAQTYKAVGGKGFAAKVATPLTFAANVADPYELAGDITASGLQKGYTRVTGTTPLTAVITKGKAKDSFTLTTTGGQTQTQKGKKPAFNPLDNFRNIFTKSQTKTQPTTNANIFTGVVGKQKITSNPFTTAFTQAEPQKRKPSDKPPIMPWDNNIGTSVPIINEPIVETRTEPKTESKTQTTTTTTNINVNVPTRTDQFRFFPPLPLGAPNVSGYSGFGYGGAKSKKYVNELDYTINSILGQNVSRTANTKRKRSRR